MYKRKGGHIYTKVTTNRRVANLNNDNWEGGFFMKHSMKL
jgi:hypothetical protein